MQVYLVGGLGVMGVLLLALGALFVLRGLAARAEITAALLEENATTPTVRTPDSDAAAAAPAPEPIRDARTARMRSDEIKQHTLTKAGPYQKIPSDHPDRQWFLNGLTIRNALNMAIMGYGVANMAVGVGVGFVVLGVGVLALGVPAVLWLSP